MEIIIALIIVGIWGSIALVGMTLIKLERTKAENLAFLNNVCDYNCGCENCEEENDDDVEEI